MELDAKNTAIVVDSTADFPEAPQRFPNWRVVPLCVRFGDELQGLRRARSRRVLRPPPLGCADTLDLAAHPRRLPRRLRGARRIRADPVAAHSRQALGHHRERAGRGAGAGRRPDPGSRLAERIGGDRDDRPGDPAQARARHERRGGGRAGRALPTRGGTALHRRHARVPRPRRPDRSGAGLGGRAAQHQADPHHQGRRGRAGQAGARKPQGVPRVRVGLHRLDPRRRRCGSGSRMRTRPSGRMRSSRWCGAPGRRPSSSWSRSWARSWAHTRAPARSASSGSTMSRSRVGS